MRASFSQNTQLLGIRLYYGISSRKYQHNLLTQSTFFETENEEPVQGITEIAVCGYKSIYEECQIEVRSLTILAGANSSGKSSIMQPLLLMKQTLEAP
ncbi:AAA family ATPase [Microcoleus sp. herbarium2]|uniref:AAA family ATPase n=1 Tax=Microcoleus sp. herbarium2 TaxID=3055433 RepID=UPI002FD5D503